MNECNTLNIWNLLKNKYDFCHEDAFELLSYLEDGGTSDVKLARHKKTNILCALKVIRKSRIRHQLQNVTRECEILKICNSTFIVDLYGIFKTSNQIFFVLEYCAGAELTVHLQRKRGKFSNVMVQFYSAEIICALEYLHSKNVVYRDLKPENIVIDMYGHAKICDFGYSKILQNPNDRTWTFCGTPDYMSPEQHKKSWSWPSDRLVEFWCFSISNVHKPIPFS